MGLSRGQFCPGVRVEAVVFYTCAGSAELFPTMRNPTFTTRLVVPALAALACMLLLAAPVVPAVADVSVYQATVPLKGNTEADRSAAFGEALKSAAVRASGRRDAGSNATIVAAASDTTRYVQQYSTTSDRMLNVGFDAKAMDRLLQQAGLPLWPLERPVTQVLLITASAAGGARAIVEGERVAERAEVERAARDRGLPISWPRGTVDAAAVRAMVAGAAAGEPASAGSRPALAGVASGGSVSWRFVQPGQTATAAGTLQDGVNLAADSLAARYAPPSTRGMSSITMRVGGMEGVRAYAGLLEYLKSLSLVRNIEVEEMADGVVTLKLAVRGDLDVLRRIASMEDRLQSGDRAGAEGGSAKEGATAVDFTFKP
jgi:hypothetical protein